MKITFLGTGSSHGIPVIGCNCPVCLSTNPRNKRLRSSLMVNADGNCFIIDVGPDFRQQMLREKVVHIDAVLFTHAHKDHTAGIDDLRAYNYLQKGALSLYAEQNVIRSIKREYEYVFAENRYPGVPELHLKQISPAPLYIKGTSVIPIRAYHNTLPILGFRMGNMAYLTDVKTIPEEEMKKLQGLKVLVLSAIRVKPHPAHVGLEEALRIIDKLKPERAYFTHISHMQHADEEIAKYVPENVFSAYDGLQLDC